MVLVSFIVQAILAMTEYFRLAALCSSEMMNRSGHPLIPVQMFSLFHGLQVEQRTGPWECTATERCSNTNEAVGSEEHVRKGTVFLDRADVRACMCKMSLNPSLYLHL